jgi:hypothetical protein
MDVLLVSAIGTDGTGSDGNIRYFEYENDKFEFLTEYKSAEPQRGIAFLPKRGINVSILAETPT